MPNFNDIDSSNYYLNRLGLNNLFYSKLKPMYGHAPSYDVVAPESEFVPDTSYNPYPYVSYKPQSLDSSSQAQARDNIGAVGYDYISDVARYEIVRVENH